MISLNSSEGCNSNTQVKIMTIKGILERAGNMQDQHVIEPKIRWVD